MIIINAFYGKAERFWNIIIIDLLSRLVLILIWLKLYIYFG